MDKIKKIKIIYKPDVENVLSVSTKISAFLNCKEILTEIIKIDDIFTETTKINKVKPACQQANTETKTTELALILGGDGTILKAARHFAPFGTPIFGVNLGRLGFLSQSQVTDVEDNLSKILNNEYRLEKRLMLSLDSNPPQNKFINNETALNDIVIKNEAYNKTLNLMISINGNPVSNYLADGVIVSTPTGSTAYTLSAGGPILEPSLDAIVIVPICPHTLTARPLVIPSSENIEIKSIDDETFYTVLDGQHQVRQLTSVNIKKSVFKAKILLIKKDNNGFYSVLREKLNWGAAPKGFFTYKSEKSELK